MSYGFCMIFFADLLADRDGLIIVRTSSRTECDADIIRLQLAEDSQSLIYVIKLILSFGRKYFKRNNLFFTLIDIGKFHIYLRKIN